MSRPRYTVTCPTCGAQPGDHCRATTTDRVTDTHTARIDAQWTWTHNDTPEQQSPHV